MCVLSVCFAVSFFFFLFFLFFFLSFVFVINNVVSGHIHYYNLVNVYKCKAQRAQYYRGIAGEKSEIKTRKRSKQRVA